MRFDWNQKKEIDNRQKHGISFEDAQTSFLDPFAIRVADVEHSRQNEDRFVLIGMSMRRGVLFVVYCERDEDTIRIISARRATRRERSDYEEIRKNFDGRNA
jgi:uncharacterized protein